MKVTKQELQECDGCGREFPILFVKEDDGMAYCDTCLTTPAPAASSGEFVSFHLQIRTTNAAFEEDPAYETARILREVADQVESGQRTWESVMDSNGNDVGRFEFHRGL